jgi:von Willebrand factor type A domain
MRTSWAKGAAAVLSAGTWIAACGGTGTHGSSGTTGGAGTGGGTGASSSGSASSSSGIGFDAGPIHDASYVQDGDACGSTAIQSMITPGTLVVVFDQSDSMNQKFTSGDGGPSGPKYQVAEDALVAALTPSETNLDVGAIFFPTANPSTTSTCTATVDPIGTPPQIPIEPGTTFLTDFTGHFSASGWKLILGTPTTAALDQADTALAGPGPANGKRAVIILTDGAPTCEGDAGTNGLLAPVQDMFSRGIKTYAVGLPGSAGAATLLNEIASAGGTSTYYSPADQASLQTALANIASQTVDQCTVTLSPAPPDPSLVYLIVTDAAHPNGEVIPEVSDAGADGWILSGNTATLTGAVCANAKAGMYSSINFVYGCPTLPQSQ